MLTTEAGLSTAQVAERIAAGQVNDVPVRSGRSVGEIIKANLFTRINAIMGVLFGVILAVGPIQDALFGGVIIANTLIGVIQELRAKRTLDRLAIVGAAHPVVRRDGHAVEVTSADLVLDDLIELGPGDQIAVDGVVVEAEQLEVDESLLTGEADPVVKEVGDPLLSGSFVTSGAGAMRATKVGRAAYAARLAEEASRFTLVNSELRGGLNTILRFVTWLIIPTGLALIVSQYLVNSDDLPEAIRRMVAGLVPMVPEGLVLLTSVAFAVGVIRLGRRRCLVQELPAIEGLARVSVVCLDKTGTLTDAAMAVAEVRELDPAAPVPEVLGLLGAADERPNTSLRAIAEAYPPPSGTEAYPASSGTEAYLPPSGTEAYPASSGTEAYPPPSGTEAYPPPSGTEAYPALLSGTRTHPASASGTGARAGWRIGERVPFSSARKWGGATLTDPDGISAQWRLGAPDVLLPAGHPALAEADAYGARGLRVLLLARVSADAPHPSTGGEEGPPLQQKTLCGGPSLHPVALVVLVQRVRAEASETLRYFAEQGVAVKVLSGDNALSVGAVARSLGLPGAEHPVDARTLPTDPAELAEVVQRHTVFGRVGPQQKRDMVAALQRAGHTVAMTGDGVNDVLALKDADIGVAMGSGSPASRAVAQIVLLDNNFGALPAVVAEGRRVIGNIERVANLFLTKTVYSVLLAVIVVLSQVPYPFLPRHLSIISSLTIGIPAFFLALAPNHERARPGFVGRVLRFAVPSGVVAMAATITSYLAARSIYRGDLAAETSAATLTLFLVGLWAVAIIARPYTWWRILLVLALGGAFAAILVVPFLQEFFQLSLVGVTAPGIAVGLAVVAGTLLELIRRLPVRDFRATTRQRGTNW